MSTPFLEAVALACERDWRLLFDKLDLRLENGEMLQISGPNGSGKTSLLRLLSGLMQPTAGEVRLKGLPLDAQRGELARNLLWIGHAAGIKGLLTAEENLTWLCALHQPASREAIWQALAAVGLRGFEDVPCHTLSAGAVDSRRAVHGARQAWCCATGATPGGPLRAGRTGRADHSPQSHRDACWLP